MRYSIIILLCYFNVLCSTAEAQVSIPDFVKLNNNTSVDSGIQIPDGETSLELITLQTGFQGFNENSQTLSTLNMLLITPYKLNDAHYQEVFLPPHTQGVFCDFEDMVNRGRKLRIDFSVK